MLLYWIVFSISAVTVGQNAPTLTGSVLPQVQTGALEGMVTDSSGAVIPGVSITVTATGGLTRTATTDMSGKYTFAALPAGSYTVTADFAGFAPYRNPSVQVQPGSTAALAIELSVTLEKQSITVQEQNSRTVTVDPDNNASAIVLQNEELDALSDDPDELASQLQTLAGPAAGPNGGQIFVDGFSGGRVPPKSSIREVRINQNPFSAEFDRPGFGRIEIITKPGTGKVRGQTFFEYGNSALDSRNPYAASQPNFQVRQYGGNLSGPLSKKASFFFDLEQRDIDDNVVINATVLDPISLQPTPFNQVSLTPSRRTSVSPRLDYQLSPSDTLTARYRLTRLTQENAGVGGMSLPSHSFGTSLQEHVAQLSETHILSARAANETRFQFTRTQASQIADNSAPTLAVLGAFTGGGAQVGRSFNLENKWELHNYTSVVAGPHILRFGARLRGVRESDTSPQNFGGTFTFSGGGFAPALDANGDVISGAAGVPIDSLERYRRTLLLSRRGLPMEAIRALGGGPGLFTIAAGNSLARVSQVDVGLFLQEDWRVRPDLSLSLGMRYETQTNIYDPTDFGPRLGFAWAPAGKHQKKKTVLRGGVGLFYDRFGQNLALQAIRFNGATQRQFTIQNPSFFGEVPSLDVLSSTPYANLLRRIAPDLVAPYSIQSSIGVEQQLPLGLTAAVTLNYSRGAHVLLSRDINAPLPGTYSPEAPGGGVRPYGPVGDIFQYESSGYYRQTKVITTLSGRIGRRLALHAFYYYNVANTTTENPNLSVADAYNLASEYGPFGMRHHFDTAGSIDLGRGVRLSLFPFARGGLPFNITSGKDLNGDGVFLDRPAFTSDASKRGVVRTPYGLLDPDPAPGAKLVPRNYGVGPAYFALTLRLSKTFAFGGSTGNPKPAKPGVTGVSYQATMGEPSPEKRYTLTVSTSVQNVFNNVNPDVPVGVLTSPLFLQSISLAPSYGPGGSAANRRIQVQLRFGF